MDWSDMIRNVGFPVTIVIVFIFAIFRASGWLANNVFNPIVKAHIEFLSEAKAFMHSTRKTMEVHEALSKSTLQDLQANTQLLRELQTEVHQGNVCRYTGTQPSKHPPS